MLLDVGRARMVVDLAQGGRIASLIVDGHELLVTSGFGPFGWGSFPMAPFAGRLRDARLTFAGRTWELPANEPPHALHGFVAEQPWQAIEGDASAIFCELAPPWPFRGRVRQRFALTADRLDIEMALETDEPQPAAIGLHPWFRRRLSGPDGGEEGDGEIEIGIEPEAMYRLGPDGIPTGELVEPDPRPWDDCFVGLARPPVVRWPGLLRLTIESTADHWVVFDEHPAGICVEPQTGPPNGPNLEPLVVQPGDPLRVAMTLRWAADEAGEGLARRG
ncbi:MAG TPA: hypothetical protein VFY18_05685 [Candidatus Limnocylindrales bacterium]|nr:hypothetical protein [Candidatus Limnocylindrales bacterium]